jgi:hypothetical protein
MPNGSVELITRRGEGFSATMPVDVRGLDFDRDWHWLEVTGRASRGLVHFVVMNFGHAPSGEPERDLLFHKKIAPTDTQDKFYVFLKPGNEKTALLFSNAVGMTQENPQNSQSHMNISSIRIVKTPKAHATAA